MIIDEKNIYFVSLILFGVSALVASVWSIRLKEENLPRWEKLPRNVMFGMILAVIDLVWCIPHSMPLVPNAMRPLLIPIAVFCAVIAYFFLDYLFSRALGGFFILLVYYFLHESFTYRTPVKPVFSICCFVLGIIGLFFCGKPYLLRDLIRQMARNKVWKHVMCTYLFVFAGFSICLAIIHLLNS